MSAVNIIKVYKIKPFYPISYSVYIKTLNHVP